MDGQIPEVVISYDECPMEYILENLAIARDLREHFKDKLWELRGEFEAREDVKTLRESVEHWTKTEAETYNAVVSRAAAEFDGKNKKPYEGVTIQERTEAEITDADKAFSYAKEKLPEALKLDTKFVETYAINNAGMVDLPFVSVRKVVKATVARDLSAYLRSE